MKIGKLPQRHKTSMDENMIPLINIVFLMLIFFMVAGQITLQEPVKVQLPKSISETPTPENPVIVVIGLDGEIAVNQEVVKQSALTSKISEYFEAAKDKKNFRLFVKVDGQLPIESLRKTLSLIKQTGIKRVSLATQH